MELNELGKLLENAISLVMDIRYILIVEILIHLAVRVWT